MLRNGCRRAAQARSLREVLSLSVITDTTKIKIALVGASLELGGQRLTRAEETAALSSTSHLSLLRHLGHQPSKLLRLLRVDLNLVLREATLNLQGM